MIFVSEAQSAAAIGWNLAFAAAREAMIAAAGPAATVFPAVIAHGSDARNRFSIKSGATDRLAGLKVGSFWPDNAARGAPRHNSTILLIDQESGRVGAVIEAGGVNAYRTAAADAVATAALARADARTLAVFGAGHQARYEVEAIRRVRDIETVLVVARDAAKARTFAAQVAGTGIAARPAEAREACGLADVIVTATSAREALFAPEWIRPGTHISAMGADAEGKQELPAPLLAVASLFCDLPQQALRIGEFQRLASSAADAARIVPIGAVLDGRSAGRRSDAEVTVFDSSGIALQDLYVGHAILQALGHQ